MELIMTVKTNVFNREFIGKAVYLNGNCGDGKRYDGYYLIKDITDKNLVVMDYKGESNALLTTDFNTHGINLTLLDKGQSII